MGVLAVANRLVLDQRRLRFCLLGRHGHRLVDLKLRDHVEWSRGLGDARGGSTVLNWRSKRVAGRVGVCLGCCQGCPQRP